MTTYKVPLSREDASALRYIVEKRQVDYATGQSAIDPTNPIWPLVEAQQWVAKLLQGEQVEIPDKPMNEARYICGRAWEVLHG